MSLLASLSDLGDEGSSLIAIEMPCFVKAQKTAMNMLGGETHVLKTLALNDAAPLECRLPGDNPLRSNLISTTQERRSVVLKIRRKKIFHNGKLISSSVVGFDIVGLVKKTIVFTNPADFQFLPAFSSTSSYKPENTQSLPGFPLEIVPQSIGRIDYEKRNQFLSFLHVSKRSKRGPVATKNKSATDQEASDNDSSDNNNDATINPSTDKRDTINSDEEEGKEKASQKKRNPDAGFTQILKFGDPIPDSHPLGKYPPRWVAKRDSTGEIFRGIQFIDKLNQLFDRIPVLKRTQISDALELGLRQHLFKECLPYAAYTYSSGPYCNLWIRYGYDPTAHPSSRIYQTLHCRFPPQYLIKLSESLTEKIGRENVHRKMVDLDSMEITDAPEEFAHRFIDKGAFARLPMSLFGYICKHQISFQVHTLTDSQLFSFLQTLPVSPICTEQSGWFTEEAVVIFRNFICEIMEQRVEKFLQCPISFAAKAIAPILARSEDQAMIETRLQVVLQDYEFFVNQNATWLLQQDIYPSPLSLSTATSTNVSSSSSSQPSAGIVPSYTPIRNLLFWLMKYRIAFATETNSGTASYSTERLVLPGRKSLSSTVSGVGVGSGGSGQEWSSTRRKPASGGSSMMVLDEKTRDQSAILSTSLQNSSINSSSMLGPLFGASAAANINTTNVASAGKPSRNVRFASAAAGDVPISSSTITTVEANAAAAVAASLQFTVNKDVLAHTTGFKMLGEDDSDSEDDDGY